MNTMARMAATAPGVAAVSNAPQSPQALLSSDPKRPVKQLLREFNAQRMLSKVVKGAHRRLSADKSAELAPTAAEVR